MKNIGEILRDLFVPRKWTIIRENTIAGETSNTIGGTLYLLQDQYGNIKKKVIKAYWL